MSFNETLDIERSYYQATANAFARSPRLEGPIEADLCVVGGGCTGLSAALHARERGYSVVLLEGGRIGWGASGRNGGQVIPGLRKSATELIRLYGETKAKELFGLAVEARDLVVGLIESTASRATSASPAISKRRSSRARWRIWRRRWSARRG